MDITDAIILLKNSGLDVKGKDNAFIYFTDPSCILPAFDTVFNYAWTISVVLTAILLFGWGCLYIRGAKYTNLFNNMKYLILIFGILGVTKPLINLVYGKDLFAQGCEIQKVSISKVAELVATREQQLTGDENLHEEFSVTDSGPFGDEDNIGTITSEESDDSQENPFQTNQVSRSYTTNSTSQATLAKGQSTNRDTIYTLPNGDTIRHTGGSRAWRNNNPGNIRASNFAMKHGAIGEKDGFAVFPDEETGTRAIVQLLSTKSYRNLSVKDAIHKWAPFSDGNNPKTYAQKVSKMTGLDANTILTTVNTDDLYKIAGAIKKVEGWTAGTEHKITTER